MVDTAPRKRGDISEDEEARLPLPDNWIRQVKVGGNGLYKNLANGIESDEHPLILSALIAARKVKLEPGWVVREAVLPDGSMDYFYCNPTLQLSMWDPPSLRQCLSDVLGAHGFSVASLWVLYENPNVQLAQISQRLVPSTNLDKTIVDPSRPPIQKAITSSNDQLPLVKGSIEDIYQSFQRQGGLAGVRYSAMKATPAAPLLEPPASLKAVSSPKQSSASDEQKSQPMLVDRQIVDSEESIDDELMDGNGGNDEILSIGSDDDESGSLGRRSSSEDDLLGPKSGEAKDYYHNSSSSHRQQPVAVTVEGGEEWDNATNEQRYYNDHNNDDYDDSSDVSSLPSMAAQEWAVHGRSKKWLELRKQTYEKEPAYTKKTHRITNNVKPPKTASGVRILTQDIKDGSNRVHDVLLKIRIGLAIKAGMPCEIFGLEKKNDKLKQSQLQYQSCRELAVLASSIVAMIRNQPERVVATMAKCYTPGDTGMVNLAFVVLHRLLHPVSTDSSMTTALLLQGFNYQLEEAAAVEDMFSDMDSKMIMARAVFISDPVTGFKWNALAQPMPLVPNVPHETVLSCLLRVYAVRRDVTSYFRTIWRPVVPAALTVLDLDLTDADTIVNSPYTFVNLITVAFRLLECTLHDRALVSFPAVATAMCRAAFEVGGSDAFHAYLFNLLILPNLVKVFTGDHDSIENENPHNVDTVPDLINQYYDLDVWWPSAGFASVDFDPTHALIWFVWRLYTGAALLDEASIEVITTKGFFTGGPLLDTSGFPDTRTKSLLHRLQLKIDRGTRCLLKMPLDSEASAFLGIDQAVALESAAQNPEYAKFMDQRLIALLLKPADMLRYTLASQRELTRVFRDLGEEMELSGLSSGSVLYREISEFLLMNEQREEWKEKEKEVNKGKTELKSTNMSTVDTEEIMMLSVDGFSDDAMTISGQPLSSNATPAEINYRYEQLLRGLTLTNRYEDTLLHIQEIIEQGYYISLRDLLFDKPFYIAPEFDANFKVVDIAIYGKNTQASIAKGRNSQYGLRKPRTVAVTTHAAGILIPHEAYKSRAKLHDEVFSGLRFGSTEPSAGAGTSFAVGRVYAPKVKAVSSRPERDVYNSAASRYTKVDVDPNKGFLLPTESRRKKTQPVETAADASMPPPPHTTGITRHEIEQRYLKSMRGYDIIPTDEFFRKRSRREQARQQQPSMYSTDETLNRRQRRQQAVGLGYVPKPTVSSLQHSGGLNRPPAEPMSSPAEPKPFPEHLRHLIRNNSSNEAESVEGTYYDEVNSPSATATATGTAAGYYDHESDYGYDYNDSQPGSPVANVNRNRNSDSNGNVNIDVARLISDFQSIFAANQQQLEQPQAPVITQRSPFVFRQPRIRQPKMPAPPSPGARYSSPTQATLHRFRESEDHNGADVRFLRDFSNGLTPNLRRSDRRSVSPEPFRPSSGRPGVPRSPPRPPQFPLQSKTSRPGARSQTPPRQYSANPNPAIDHDDDNNHYRDDEDSDNNNNGREGYDSSDSDGQRRGRSRTRDQDGIHASTASSRARSRSHSLDGSTRADSRSSRRSSQRSKHTARSSSRQQFQQNHQPSNVAVVGNHQKKIEPALEHHEVDRRRLPHRNNDAVNSFNNRNNEPSYRDPRGELFSPSPEPRPHNDPQQQPMAFRSEPPQQVDSKVVAAGNGNRNITPFTNADNNSTNHNNNVDDAASPTDAPIEPNATNAAAESNQVPSLASPPPKPPLNERRKSLSNIAAVFLMGGKIAKDKKDPPVVASTFTTTAPAPPSVPVVAATDSDIDMPKRRWSFNRSKPQTNESTTEQQTEPPAKPLRMQPEEKPNAPASEFHTAAKIWAASVSAEAPAATAHHTSSNSSERSSEETKDKKRNGGRDDQQQQQQQQQHQQTTLDEQEQDNENDDGSPAGQGSLLLMAPGNDEAGSRKSRSVKVLSRRQSLWNVNDLKRLLQTGVKVQKHGRSGFPKTRLLIYDESTQELRWDDIKPPASGGQMMRRMSIFGNKAPSITSMPISSILAIKKGLVSDVLVKAKGVDPSCALYVESNVKNLSIVFDNAGERDRAAKALESIIADTA